ncbi:MAG: ATP-binding cassette domain-containing protein, partial [Myxococcota bacterium]|nr:ATP-binding cassette domain-containing protein [Myxococcota bacterium]
MEFVSADEEKVLSVSILGGRDKDGAPEPVSEVTVNAGEVVCIVGPTGSGKSRLLADIEWVAQGDTPTGRRVLLGGEKPDPKWRFSTEHKLVAQLSQNMNFVMDLSVQEFVALHAESRGVADADAAVQRIWESGNQLAGEPFGLDTPVTSLSGGQSRALMIADTAILSSSPIVLIDEIENAGIDRRRALDVLLKEEKIVLMATHDPILALYGDRRLVLRNGAMQQVITPTEAELANVEELRAMDARMMELRNRLRQGELLEEI